jgi:hypothetical protein
MKTCFCTKIIGGIPSDNEYLESYHVEIHLSFSRYRIKEKNSSYFNEFIEELQMFKRNNINT